MFCYFKLQADKFISNYAHNLDFCQFYIILYIVSFWCDSVQLQSSKRNKWCQNDNKWKS